MLAKLPAVFKKDGLVTAGNASGVSDGAAAVVVASEESVQVLLVATSAEVFLQTHPSEAAPNATGSHCRLAREL